MIHLYHHHNLLFTILRHCAQAQLIGLQVLRSMLQKGSGEKSNSFEIFFVGELVGDILPLIQKNFEVISLLLYTYFLYSSISQSTFQRFCFLIIPSFPLATERWYEQGISGNSWGVFKTSDTSASSIKI